MTLSVEHQSKIIQAVDTIKTGEYPAGREITGIWGNKPLLLATYSHPSIDTEARIVIGDLMWQEITDSNPQAFTELQLAWEPSPPGKYKILEIPLPTAQNRSNRVVIDSGFAVIPWWLPATEANISHFYGAFLSEDTWVQAASTLTIELQNTNLSNDRINQTVKNLFCLKDIYRRALSMNNTGQTLSLVAENLYRTVAADLIGQEIVGRFKPKTGGITTIGKRLNETLLVLDKLTPLEAILQKLLNQGEQGLFIGGNTFNEIVYAGYSTAKNKFALDEVDPGSAKRKDKLSPISKENLIKLLQSGEIFPTGKVFMMALTYIASQLPVVHMGNDYGWREKALKAMNATRPFHQLFPEFADSWPFINPVINGQPYTGEMVTLAGLYVLFKGKQNLADYVWQSLSRGSPINLEV